MLKFTWVCETDFAASLSRAYPGLIPYRRRRQQPRVDVAKGDHMKGNDNVIALLNEVLKAELTAINQYFLHAEMCENWGYGKLAKLGRKESIEEMHHAEWLMERILYLDGTPTMSELFPLRIGQNVKEQIQNDLQLEYEAVARLNRGVKLCVEVNDNGSRELLVKILTDEEHHVDFLEAQLHAISEVGYDNYLAQQLESESH
jgi:bacterioferritin